MPTDWSLLVLDLDGTFLAPDGSVPDANRDAIGRVRDADIDFLFATGRCRNETLHVLESVDYSGPAIVAGGAMLAESACGTTIDRITIEPDVVSRIVDHLHDEGHASLILKDHHATGYDYLVVGDHGMHPVSEWWMDAFNITFRQIDRLESDPDPEHTIRVGGIGEAPRMEGAAERIGSDLGHLTRMLNWPAVTASHLSGAPIHIVEVFAPDVDKWTMALRHCHNKGHDHTRIVAIGDGLNDIGMLQSASLGIAMGNAEPRVCAVADWTTGSNQDDGFAQAIDRILDEECPE